MLLLPVLVPLGLLIALLVLVDSPGPVLYRSRRVGVGGIGFAMLKFRSMRRDHNGPSISCENDERLTPLGRFLASTRLDEIPQLINVARGEMRMVGPRPELEEFVSEHPEAYEQILSVPPGLTGLSQLEYAGEGRALAAAPDRLKAYREQILPAKLALDRRYVGTRTVRGDLWILARTALVPFLRLRLALRTVHALRAEVPAGLYEVAGVATIAMLVLTSFSFIAGA